MLALAFIVSFLAAARYLKELGRPVDWAYEMVFAALVGGIVGARLWWVAEHFSEAKHDLIGSLFSGSGLVFHGGALGGATAALLRALLAGLTQPQVVSILMGAGGSAFLWLRRNAGAQETVASSSSSRTRRASSAGA